MPPGTRAVATQTTSSRGSPAAPGRPAGPRRPGWHGDDAGRQGEQGGHAGVGVGGGATAWAVTTPAAQQDAQRLEARRGRHEAAQRAPGTGRAARWR